MSLFSRLFGALFGKHDVAADLDDDASPRRASGGSDGSSAAGRATLDSNLETRAWFDGVEPTPRDSIDSNPDSARWFRRPAWVAPGDTLHHTNKIASGGRPSRA